jgi:hypothetical protein
MVASTGPDKLVVLWDGLKKASSATSPRVVHTLAAGEEALVDLVWAGPTSLVALDAAGRLGVNKISKKGTPSGEGEWSVPQSGAAI